MIKVIKKKNKNKQKLSVNDETYISDVILILGILFRPADRRSEGSFARALPGRTSCATPWTVPAALLTTGHSSAQSSTANSSEDGTTLGARTQEWTVGQIVAPN